MSKAELERKLIKARARVRAANAGRPRSSGPRHPGGDLVKRTGPNDVVVEYRRKLLGKPTAKGMALRHAENALDLMLFRGWLTKPLHETGSAYRRLYLAAFPALPDMKTTRVDEAPGEHRSATETGVQAPSLPNPDGNPAAMTMLRAVWRVLELRPGAGDQVFDVCIVKSAWPTWLQAMIINRALTPPEKSARAAFFQGLHIIGQVLARPGLAHFREVA